jgi:AP-3 complex subunit mu
MDIIMDAEGGIVRVGVRGSIEVNCRLSGMPDVLLVLSGTELFDDVSYHRCVRHARYETDRSLSFVPPDGKFTLFSYRCKPLRSLQPPFYVTPQVTFNKLGGRLNCMVGLRHGGSSTDREKEIHRVVVHIPLPPQTETVNVNTCSHGTFSFNSSTKILSWRIGSLTTTTPSLSGEFAFGQGSKDVVECTGESVSVEFQIPNHSVSNIRVDSVNLTNESYKPYKGVKYIAKAGRFNIRTV